MSLHYVVVLYKNDAVLYDGPKPNANDFTHAVLIVTDSQGQDTVFEFSGRGVEINCSSHVALSDGWFLNQECQWVGAVTQHGSFPSTLKLEAMINKARDGTFTSEVFASKKGKNCIAFTDALVHWGMRQQEGQQQPRSSHNKRGRSQEAKSTTVATKHPFTWRLHKDSSLPLPVSPPWLSNDDIAGVLKNAEEEPSVASKHPFTGRLHKGDFSSLPLPVPPPLLSNDIAGLLNNALARHPTMHAKQEMIGFIFKDAHLSAPEIGALLPSVDISTITKGLAKASSHSTMDIETKRIDNHRDTVHSWEKAFFKECMMPFFIDPRSGSRENKKEKPLYRTRFTQLSLWVKYLTIIPNMIDRAEKANAAAAPYPLHTNLTGMPRHYGFFLTHLLSMIRYRQEHNSSQCHYCDSLDDARTELKDLGDVDEASLAKNDPILSKLIDVQKRIAFGEHHQERWHRQSGFIHNLRYNPKPGQCLIQTDYYSFYSYTKKQNVLSVVLRYLDKHNAVQVEHLHYLSTHPHDYYFTGVAFQHVFSSEADILCDIHGPKFSEVFIAGDTAMFKGPSLCCFRHIALESKIMHVEVVPFCAKHGRNECDGDAGHIKPIAEQMVIDKQFPEKQPWKFCSTIVERSPGSKTRAFPLNSIIPAKYKEIDAMLPSGSVGAIYPPSRGFGQILLTGTPAHSLFCRTDVGIPEPWRLEKQGYPLPVGTKPPEWLLVDLASKPTEQCLPCAAFFMKPVPKVHAPCPFACYTKYSRCGICGKREAGHNARSCPKNKNKALILDDLKSICRGLKLKITGKTKKELIQMIAAHIDDEVADVCLGDAEMLEEGELEDDSDLSDEASEVFDLTTAL